LEGARPQRPRPDGTLVPHRPDNAESPSLPKRPNYNSEKRRREIDKKRKKEEKRQRKLESRRQPGDPIPPPPERPPMER
jgi:hypothetical protein